MASSKLKYSCTDAAGPYHIRSDCRKFNPEKQYSENIDEVSGWTLNFSDKIAGRPVYEQYRNCTANKGFKAGVPSNLLQRDFNAKQPSWSPSAW